MAEFLATKDEDLGPRCYVFDTYGVCPAGLNCRFGKGHVDPSTGEVVVSEIPLERRPAIQQAATTMNVLPYGLGGQLQRGKYEFLYAPPLHSSKHRQQQLQQHQQHQQLSSSTTTTAGARTQSTSSSSTSAVQPTLMWSKKGGIVTNTIEAPSSVLPQEDITSNDAATLATKAPREIKRIDFKDKVYVAPLTTVGNLPFRRVMKTLGADITIGEMAMAENIVAGQPSEWALLRRHVSEDIFGVQLAGCHIDTMSRAAELIASTCSVDFVDLNCGCPLDLVCNRGMGASMMGKHGRLRDLVVTMSRILPCPVTVKMRTGIEKDRDLRFAHKLISKMRIWSACGDNFSDFVKRSPKALPLPLYNERDISSLSGVAGDSFSSLSSYVSSFPVAAVTVHGRTRQQRYSQTADWSYISTCVDAANAETVTCPPLVQLTSDGYDLSHPRVVKAWGLQEGEIERARKEEERIGLTATAGISNSTNVGKLHVRPNRIPVIGNGDVMSYAEWREHIDKTGVQTCLLARGVLVKPWLCTEIQEKRESWDISSSERLEILRKFANYGLEHWGSDQNGVNHTRRFLLEWLAFLYRYIPTGLLERAQRIGEKCPPPVVARDDLEQLMLSPDASDWVKISELLLGPVPKDYRFVPKHKSSQAYEGADDNNNNKGDEKMSSQGAGDKRGRVDEEEEVDDAEG